MADEPGTAAQELSRRDDESYQLLAESIPQAVWTTDGRGHLHYFSCRWYEYTGATSEQSRGGGWRTPDGHASVRVDVIDTGPGIAADHQVELFKEFVRVNPGDKLGTELGLAISQRLATMLGGRITLQSEPGRGSTFSLRLPITRR